MKIFLSYSFRFGHDLTRAVERLLATHDLPPPITGRKLGGQAVDAAVEAKIRESDALISLLAMNPNPQPGESPWSQSVFEEYMYAKNRPMPCIAVVEKGLAFGGMSNKERINHARKLQRKRLRRRSRRLSSQLQKSRRQGSLSRRKRAPKNPRLRNR